MMTGKEWMLALGERSGVPMDTDELLRGKVSERRRKELERAEEKDDAKHKADMAELRKKEEAATKETEKIESKTTAPLEPPVKLTGEIALGKFDFQEQVKESKQEAKEAQQFMAQKVDELEKGKKEMEERAHKAELQVVQAALTGKIENLEKSIQAGMSQKSFVDQYEEIIGMAKKVGLTMPEAGVGDATTKLEMLKIQQQMAREEREFKWQMKQDDKKWQLDMQKLQDERGFRAQELEMERTKRSEMADSIKSAAVALGKSIVATESAGEGISEASPVPKGKSYSIEIPEGESGTMGCPSCDEELGIGPTQRTAVCAGCGSRIKIKRVSGKPSEEAEEE